MSAFGSKRKARKIQTDDEEEVANNTKSSIESVNAPTPGLLSLTSNRKSFKKSALRRSVAFDNNDANDTAASDSGVANKPTIGPSSSLIKRKKPKAAKLSFGPGEIISGDAAEALEDDESFTPKKPSLGRRVVEGNALRRSISFPTRSTEDDQDRPMYSKDYLDQLKSSTPTAPKDLQAIHATAEDEEGLDASELDGAMIVDADASSANTPPIIPSEAQIREKKERRSRLAHEKDFISFDDAERDSRQTLSLLPRKKKEESRLVREDEDIAEGFDEFVDDGRIALGKKQERAARRKHRKEMAAMIEQAEGSLDEESDDSEAERRAAYEAAQTRAGMDGLHKPNDEMRASIAQVPAKITPLPALSECLERLQVTLRTMEQEMAKRHKEMEESKQEKIDIGKREAEVQELLKQAGERYSALKADTNGAATLPQTLGGAHIASFGAPVVLDRGLESFGNTPTVRPDIEEVG